MAKTVVAINTVHLRPDPKKPVVVQEPKSVFTIDDEASYNELKGLGAIRDATKGDIAAAQPDAKEPAGKPKRLTVKGSGNAWSIFQGDTEIQDGFTSKSAAESAAFEKMNNAGSDLVG